MFSVRTVVRPYFAHLFTIVFCLDRDVYHTLIHLCQSACSLTGLSRWRGCSCRYCGVGVCELALICVLPTPRLVLVKNDCFSIYFTLEYYIYIYIDVVVSLGENQFWRILVSTFNWLLFVKMYGLSFWYSKQICLRITEMC